MGMNPLAKNKVSMQQQSFAVSRQNQGKAVHLIDNFTNGIKRQVQKNLKDFSTIATIKRLIQRSELDPSDKHILESIKRMEKDKIHAQVAIEMSEIARNRAEGMQKSTIFKLIPYFIGIAALLVLVGSSFFAQEYSLSDPTIVRNLIILPFAVALLIWGMVQRNKSKVEMVSANILFQAAAAYASAKAQGKGKVGALQNLQEMRMRAKNQQAKEQAAKKDNKKEKKDNKKK